MSVPCGESIYIYSTLVFQTPIHEHPISDFEFTTQKRFCANDGCTLDYEKHERGFVRGYPCSLVHHCGKQFCYLCVGAFLHPLHRHTLFWCKPSEFHCVGAQQLTGCAASLAPYSTTFGRHAYCMVCTVSLCETCVRSPNLPILPIHPHPLVKNTKSYERQFCAGKFPGVGYIHPRKKLEEDSETYSCTTCRIGPLCKFCIDYVPPQPCTLFDENQFPEDIWSQIFKEIISSKFTLSSWFLVSKKIKNIVFTFLKCCDSGTLIKIFSTDKISLDDDSSKYSPAFTESQNLEFQRNIFHEAVGIPRIPEDFSMCFNFVKSSIRPIVEDFFRIFWCEERMNDFELNHRRMAHKVYLSALKCFNLEKFKKMWQYQKAINFLKQKISDIEHRIQRFHTNQHSKSFQPNERRNLKKTVKYRQKDFKGDIYETKTYAFSCASYFRPTEDFLKEHWNNPVYWPLKNYKDLAVPYFVFNIRTMNCANFLEKNIPEALTFIPKKIEDPSLFREFDYALNFLARNLPRMYKGAAANLCKKVPTEFQESVEIAKWMIKHGAALDSQDRHGNTPLHSALSRGNFALAYFFLETNPKIISVKNCLDENPFEHARKSISLDWFHQFVSCFGSVDMIKLVIENVGS